MHLRSVWKALIRSPRAHLNARAKWDGAQNDAGAGTEWRFALLSEKKSNIKITAQFSEGVNHQKSARSVTVVPSDVWVIIVQSNRRICSFHSKMPKAFSLHSFGSFSQSKELINARGNYSLVEIRVSYFIRNHLFDSFQMRVHRVVKWCCLMSERVRVLTGRMLLSLNPSLKRRLKSWVMLCSWFLVACAFVEV